MPTREREENFLPRAQALLAEHARRRTVLEVEIGGEGERGTGEGVHAEFFTVCAGALQARDHNAKTPMWVDGGDAEAEHVHCATGLFPKALRPGDEEGELGERLAERFGFLGRLLGKALIAAKDYENGLDALLEAVRLDPAVESDGAEAKAAMLSVFELLGLEDPIANDYRFKLSLELFA